MDCNAMGHACNLLEELMRRQGVRLLGDMLSVAGQ